MNRLQILKDIELAKTQKGLDSQLDVEIANLECSTDFNSTVQRDKRT